MSLKHFHVLFIFLSVFTCLAFGAWSILTFGLPKSFQIMGWISAGAGVLLLGYGIHFVKKMNKIIT